MYILTVQSPTPFKLNILLSIHMANQVSVIIAASYSIILVFGGQAIGKLYLITHTLLTYIAIANPVSFYAEV